MEPIRNARTFRFHSGNDYPLLLFDPYYYYYPYYPIILSRTTRK
jgi:hypothetical protein